MMAYPQNQKNACFFDQKNTIMLSFIGSIMSKGPSARKFYCIGGTILLVGVVIVAGSAIVYFCAPSLFLTFTTATVKTLAYIKTATVTQALWKALLATNSYLQAHLIQPLLNLMFNIGNLILGILKFNPVAHTVITTTVGATVLFGATIGLAVGAKKTLDLFDERPVRKINT